MLKQSLYWEPDIKPSSSPEKTEAHASFPRRYKLFLRVKEVENLKISVKSNQMLAITAMKAGKREFTYLL